MTMHPTGIDDYQLRITTDPMVDPDQWEISWDGGNTWEPCTGTDGEWTLWLVAGPEADLSGIPDNVVLKVLEYGVTQTIVRCKLNPRVIVRDAPAITVTR